jgi:2-dehydropantoate 2-reductase
LRIAVVGAGAIGSLFGGFLAKAGNEVTLIGRRSHMEAIRLRGLTIDDSQHQTITNLQAISDIAEAEEGGFELVLLTVKAYDTAGAASAARALMGERTVLVSLQNGLGVEEFALEFIRRASLMRGVTSCGAILDKPGVIIPTGMGETVVGELDGVITTRVQRVAEALEGSGFPTRVTSNISGAVWMKTLVNAGINPFAALTGMRNGELLRVEGLKGLMVETVEEGRRVAERLKVVLEGDPVAKMVMTAEATFNNINSMLIDVERGQPTEIDFINGAIWHLGEGVGISTPLNRFLTYLVKARASKVLGGVKFG